VEHAGTDAGFAEEEYESTVVGFWHYDFCTFVVFYDILSDLDVILLHLRFLAFF